MYAYAAPGEIPFSSQQLKLQEPCPLSYLVTLVYSKCCVEKEISPASPYIQMRPAEIPLSIQLFKIQEPCPPFQMVILVEDRLLQS